MADNFTWVNNQLAQWMQATGHRYGVPNHCIDQMLQQFSKEQTLTLLTTMIELRK